MTHRMALLPMLGLGLVVVMLASAPAADCSTGSTEDQVACLNKKATELEAKLEALTKHSLKWNDRVTLVNEDAHLPALSGEPGAQRARAHGRLRQVLRQNPGASLDGAQALSIDHGIVRGHAGTGG